MSYDPKKHHRRSIRLKGYDYSREGLYFITICVRHHIYLFGSVENGIMFLNDAGRMIEKWCPVSRYRVVKEAGQYLMRLVSAH